MKAENTRRNFSSEIIDDDVDVLCTETLMFHPKPKANNSCWASFYKARYLTIRHLTCPVPYLPHSFPIIGGKSVLECSYFFLALILLVVFCRIDGEGAMADTHASGWFTGAFGALTVLLALKNNIASIMFGISFERALFYHKFSAIMCYFTAAAHTFIVFYHHEQKNGIGFVLTAVLLSLGASYFFLVGKNPSQYYSS